MACFIVPATEAIVVTAITKLAKRNADCGKVVSAPEAAAKNPFAGKGKWLSNLLWGGSALLAFEHMWHGEITPWAPFLTAAANPVDTASMLQEMSTVGVSMALCVTAAWVVLCLVTNAIAKRNPEGAVESAQ